MAGKIAFKPLLPLCLDRNERGFSIFAIHKRSKPEVSSCQVRVGAILGTNEKRAEVLKLRELLLKIPSFGRALDEDGVFHISNETYMAPAGS